jgi:uncharacterized repeat protein (TIGR02543 family)
MTEQNQKTTAPEVTAATSATSTTKTLRGLYRNVNISVKTLNLVIIGLGAAIVLCLIIGLSNRGFLVTFDSLGGTAVESQKYLYGDLVEVEETPTREGYTFTGWYRDANLTLPWDLENDTVTEPMTLYAGWQENP